MAKNDQQQTEEDLTDDVAPHAENVESEQLAEDSKKTKGQDCECEDCSCGTCDCEDCDKCQKIKAELEEMTTKYKRALADYQNLEKRVAEGRSELAAWAGSEVIKKILPVMDHFDKALGGVSEDEAKSGWFKGVKMSVLQLQQVMQSEGLEQIETDGQFDPTLHEAVDTKEGKDGQILEVVEKGWKLNGKIVKPARVVVGKKG
jgi:molecular chaperone GrpE